ncbi:MAG: hypothetical protein ACFFDT_26810, partial [Candidatus Hodarchaeota archaeon]
IQTSEGGYLLLGRIFNDNGCLDFYLMKVNAIGQIEWERTIGGSLNDLSYSLIHTNDGGYACAGSYSSGAEESHYWLIKIDGSGNVQWNQTYGGSYRDPLTSNQVLPVLEALTRIAVVGAVIIGILVVGVLTLKMVSVVNKSQ